MILVVCAAVGAVIAAGTWRAMADVFDQPLFARSNYRKAQVPVGAGIVLALTAIAVEAGLAMLDRLRPDTVGDPGSRLLILFAVVAFCLLGLLDDLAAEGDDRGFRGHLAAMSHGRLTTGGVKLVGGGLVALAVACSVGNRGGGEVIVDAALIALGANLGNLLDRAPGRTIKFGLVAMVAMGVAASGLERSALIGVAVVAGAALGLLAFDLGEKLMLGDAGSNVVGAASGMGVVFTCGLTARVVVLVVVLGLNVASEKVSFSRVIDGFAPLRAFDRLGRRTLQ